MFPNPLTTPSTANVFRFVKLLKNAWLTSRFPYTYRANVVTADLLKQAGIVKKKLDGLKVLGNGKLEKKVNVTCNKISASAKAAIEKAGGKVEVI